MRNNLKYYIFGTFGGFLLGALIGRGELLDNKECYQIYHRDDRPSVMRFYNSYGFDAIYVETEKGSSKFKNLGYHLSKFKYQSERNLERINIENLINWNDETK